MRLVVGPGVNVSSQEIVKSKPYADWQNTVGRDVRGEIMVLEVDQYGGEIHSLMVKITPDGMPRPIRTILRSPTVDALTILTDGRNHHVVLAQQYRPSVGLSVLSNPAGGMGWNEHPYAAAQREVREELGLGKTIPVKCSLLLPHPVLATPGITNERVYMVRAEIRVPRASLRSAVDRLHGKETGVVAEGEHIVVQVEPIRRARQRVEREVFPDAKTLLSFRLTGI